MRSQSSTRLKNLLRQTDGAARDPSNIPPLWRGLPLTGEAGRRKLRFHYGNEGQALQSVILTGVAAVTAVMLVPSLADAQSPSGAKATKSQRQAASRPFRNCAEARAAGAAPVYRGDPGYARHLDRDNDGIGCESSRGRRR